MQRKGEGAMKYTTKNEFGHFDFEEAHVGDIQITDGLFWMVLDHVIILPENSCNRDIQNMRTNHLVFKVEDGTVAAIIEEGVKIYDANGVLKEQIADRELSREEYQKAAEQFLDGYVISAKKEETDAKISYTFVIDAADEHTYMLRVSGSGDTQEWDRFMNMESM